MPSSITHFRPYHNILSLSPRRFKPVLKAKSASILKLRDKSKHFTDIPPYVLPQAQGQKLSSPFAIGFPRQQACPKGKKLFKKGRW